MPRRICHGLCIAVISGTIATAIAQDRTNSTPVPNKNSSQAQSTNVVVGGTTPFTVTANGNGALFYQWSFADSNAALTTVGQSNGSTVLTLAQLPNSGQSQPVITNGSVASAAGSGSSSQPDPGRFLFEKHCAVCHGLHGEGGRGPTLAQPSLPRASDDASLFRIISEGIKGTQMPAAHLEQDELTHVAQYVRFLGTQPHQAVFGNAARGARIYANKGGCVHCHMIHGEGGSFGPDLTDVGRRRSAEYLRRAVVDPNAAVPQSYSPWRSDVSLPENFLYVTLVTKDGQELSGVRVNEDTFSIQIREATGAIDSFFKSELAELHKQFGKSPMPSYAEALSNEELNDLVAYLASLRIRK